MNNKSLLGQSPEELKEIVVGLGLPAFTAKQIAGWIYGKHVDSIDKMTNLSLDARRRLSEAYAIGCSAPVKCQRSVDGTAKYLYRTSDGHFVETVYIPDGDRATLCVSSQVGCKMGCAFCMTGRQGFVRSLSAADILNQIYSLPERDTLTNIVFMGQGEPMDNLDNVLRATEALTAPWGYAWSPKRITVSTVGLAKGLIRFLDESRKAFGIADIAALLKQYDFCRKGAHRPEGAAQRRLSFEYIVFKGINDTRRHADALIRLLDGLDCRINLIRFHDIPDTPLKGVSDEEMIALRDYLTNHGLFTTVRASRGQDIFAACGLLSTAEEEKNNGSRQEN